MSKSYCDKASIILKEQTTVKNAKLLIDRAISLGIKFDRSAKDIITQISREGLSNSIDDLEKNLPNRKTIYGYVDRVSIMFSGYKSLRVNMSVHPDFWMHEYPDYLNDVPIPPYDRLSDNIKAAKLLLDLTEDFVIGGFRISSYSLIFSFFEHDIPYFSKETERLLGENNIIAVYARFESSSTEITFSEFFPEIAELNNYEFINSPTDTSFPNNLEARFLHGFTSMNFEEYFFLRSKDFKEHIVKLRLSGNVFMIFPQEPYKMKITEDCQGIDTEFYLRIILNLVEDLGIEELVCHIKN